MGLNSNLKLFAKKLQLLRLDCIFVLAFFIIFAKVVPYKEIQKKKIMIKKTVSLGMIMLLFACGNNKKQDQKNETKNSDSEAVAAYSELIAGEASYYKENPFGEIVELKGRNITGDTVIFKLSETEMLVKGDYLIMKNVLSSPVFRIFKLPELRHIKSVGMTGKGRDEFNFPTLVPTSDPSLLCYIFENTNQKLYSLDKDGNLTYCKEPFQAKTSTGKFVNGVLVSSGRGYGSKQMVNLGKDDFIYSERDAKTISRTRSVGDSTWTEEIFNFGFNPKIKSPFAYIGSFAANQSKNRMVYAYKYVKMLKFMDLEAKTVRTINFEKKSAQEDNNNQQMDANITHFWKISAQDDYVYLLYSGRTPPEAYNDNKEGNHYIYIEQYDWNGNPIKKYKLDHWGYFTIDKKNKKIYLASLYFDDPFVVYDLM